MTTCTKQSQSFQDLGVIHSEYARIVGWKNVIYGLNAIDLTKILLFWIIQNLKVKVRLWTCFNDIKNEIFYD
jgi:hypothetical protein